MADIYFGEMKHESELKAGLRRIEPDVHFDLGAALNIWHPRIDEWQGIFIRGRHVGTMDRGLIPEFTIFELIDGLPEKVLRVGWRDTLQGLTKRGVPGFTWDRFCREFGIDYRKFRGDSAELQTVVPAAVR